MPNHYHILLRQETENGISRFIKNIADSYTKYFNIKNERVGPLFQGQFKSVLVDSDEQLLHVSRYIHLNPYTSHIVKNVKDVVTYPWSSFNEYVLGNKEHCNPKIILSSFASGEKYNEFVLNQADYQKKLENIKHLLLE